MTRGSCWLLLPTPLVVPAYETYHKVYTLKEWGGGDNTLTTMRRAAAQASRDGLGSPKVARLRIESLGPVLSPPSCALPPAHR